MDRSVLEDAAKLVARLMMSLLFIWSGYGIVQAYESVAEYMTASGVSGSLLPVVIFTELGFGLCIFLGLMTRVAALCLAGFCLLTARYFHFYPEDLTQMQMLFKNITMSGGFIVLAMSGAGRFALDPWVLRRRWAALV